MKFSVQFQVYVAVTVIITITHNALSAPLDQNKLSLLDKQGYEVISGAEEFITPVNNNGIDIPEGLVQQKPDILLYGKFVVLRRKGFMTVNDFDNVASAGAETPFRNLARDPQPSSTPEIEEVLKAQEAQEDEGGAIVFPTDVTTSKKKYIRQRKTSDEGKPSPLPYFHNPSRTTQISQASSTIFPEIKDSSSETRKQNPSTSHNAAKKNEKLSPVFEEILSKSVQSTEVPEEKTIEDIEGMTSDEIVEWTKWNLNTDQIYQLLNDVETENDSSDSESDEEGMTTESAIGYNSFIQVPSRGNVSTGCPEGQKKNHKGICTQLYVHNARLKTRMTRGNVKAKLTSLFGSLKALESMSIDSLVDSEKELIKEAVRIHREIRNRAITQDMHKRLSSTTGVSEALRASMSS